MEKLTKKKEREFTNELIALKQIADHHWAETLLQIDLNNYGMSYVSHCGIVSFSATRLEKAKEYFQSLVADIEKYKIDHYMREQISRTKDSLYAQPKFV